MMINRLWWKFLHRWYPKYQYNKIHIKSLEPGYHDPDSRMLHACFGLFAEWFDYNVNEAKLMNKETVDENNPGGWDEIVALYQWWTVERLEAEKSKDYHHTRWERDAQKEDEMLIRLMQIRRSIWYL